MHSMFIHSTYTSALNVAHHREEFSGLHCFLLDDEMQRFPRFLVSPPATPKQMVSTNYPDVLGVPQGTSESLTLFAALYTVAIKKASTSVPPDRHELFMLTESRVGSE